MRKVVERDLVPLGAPQRRHMIHGGEFDLQQINRVSSLLVLVLVAGFGRDQPTTCLGTL
jgi:hypothetical protein